MSNEKSSKLPIIVALLIGFVGGVVFTFWGKVEPYRERDAKTVETLNILQREAMTERNYGNLSPAQHKANKELMAIFGKAVSEQAQMTKDKLKEPEWFEFSSPGK